MDPARLRELLDMVGSGQLTSDEAVRALSKLPFEDLGIARLDHHRHLRMGIPEVVFGEGKTAEQISTIAAKILEHHGRVLVTRVDPEKAEQVRLRLPELTYEKSARLLAAAQQPATRIEIEKVAIIAAGTSDLPVAEEAALTLEFEGVRCERIYDVGVAGIHRLFDSLPRFENAPAVVVVAGMEGALPSVVGGLIAQPIIAVPTSIGYGAALSGFTALLSMLTSCASGLTVVNIDNGFGAAMAVLRIVGRARNQGRLNSESLERSVGEAKT
jgi:NCAIR mutase (PurE)-related protein